MKSIDALPDNLTIDLVLDRINMLDKIEQGFKCIEKGRVHSTEEVKAKLRKCSSEK